jgi:hypothetical protein
LREERKALGSKDFVIFADLVEGRGAETGIDEELVEVDAMERVEAADASEWTDTLDLRDVADAVDVIGDAEDEVESSTVDAAADAGREDVVAFELTDRSGVGVGVRVLPENAVDCGIGGKTSDMK